MAKYLCFPMSNPPSRKALQQFVSRRWSPRGEVGPSATPTRPRGVGKHPATCHPRALLNQVPVFCGLVDDNIYRLIKRPFSWLLERARA